VLLVLPDSLLEPFSVRTPPYIHTENSLTVYARLFFSDALKTEFGSVNTH